MQSNAVRRGLGIATVTAAQTLAAVACQSSSPPELLSRTAPPSAPFPAATVTAAKTATPRTPALPPTPPTPPTRPSPTAARPTAEFQVAEDDPLRGKFTLADATVGLPPRGKLVATMKTDKGTLECELWPAKAPITVATFVGLARGLRPWKTSGTEWVKRPLYDGTPFHRIIPGFMIQGGDPQGDGSGDPGFMIPDEIWEGAKHDQRGLLCMANRGPNTNGSQFFIMDGVAPHLDGGYTIFGRCSPDSVIQSIASSPTAGDHTGSRPRIVSVTVKRVKG